MIKLQDQVCIALEFEDNQAKFSEDTWQHQNGSGGGLSRALAGGRIFEKAGVNFLPCSRTAIACCGYTKAIPN